MGPDEFLHAAEALRKQLEQDSDDMRKKTFIVWNGYLHSMYVLGENSLENAKRLGYLDVRELYPDIVPETLEEFARGFYAKEEPANMYLVPQ